MKFKYILLVVYAVVVALLFASVIHSGYSYLFDKDELFHINVVFLIRHGLIPYKDFFDTYTLLFSWFLTPVSYITGFTFQFLEAARIPMIGLFITRIILIYFITKKLFGSTVAYIGIPLSLFDPFTVMTGMQVRPDNFMMTLYIAGIYFVFLWYIDGKTWVLLLGGLLFGTSVVTLLKNIPATFVFIVFILNELRNKRDYLRMEKFLLALVIPFICYAGWAWYKGVLSPMIQQIVFEPKRLNDILLFPENILNYYRTPNPALYGFTGRPLTWVYELCLPLVTFAGMIIIILNLRSFGTKFKLICWFITACLLQWVSLLFVRSVFIQYFLPVSWFFAVFSAYALFRVYEAFVVNRIYKQIVSVSSILLLIGGLMVSWKANNTRAINSYAGQKSYLEKQWRIIPENSPVFPGALFRISIYPVGYNWAPGDFFPYFVKRYGSPSVYLERYRIPYVLLDPYSFSFIDTPTQDYIRTHYSQNILDDTLWVLKN